jgi:hypothetical protein
MVPKNPVEQAGLVLGAKQATAQQLINAALHVGDARAAVWLVYLGGWSSLLLATMRCLVVMGKVRVVCPCFKQAGDRADAALQTGTERSSTLIKQEARSLLDQAGAAQTVSTWVPDVRAGLCVAMHSTLRWNAFSSFGTFEYV